LDIFPSSRFSPFGASRVSPLGHSSPNVTIISFFRVHLKDHRYIFSIAFTLYFCVFRGEISNRRQTVEMKISEKRNKGNNRYRCLNVTTLSWPLGWITALFIFRKKNTLELYREIILSEVIFCGVVCEFKFDIVSEKPNLTRGEGINVLCLV
jgi:hypothetical protein